MAKSKTTKQVTNTKSKKKPSPADEVTVCRRRTNRRQSEAAAAQPVAPAPAPAVDTPRPPERRVKVPRRRQIDPTTCERDYTGDEIEFMHALDAYKRANGRMFPTCSEILEVVRALGYAKQGVLTYDETREGAAEEMIMSSAGLAD